MLLEVGFWPRTQDVGHRAHFNLRRGARHDDDRGDTSGACCQRNALRVIAGGGTDHTALRGHLGQMRDFVVSAANLEGKHRLQVFPLEENLIVQSA